MDRHDNIGYGNIALPGLKAIAQFAEKHSIPMILETPDSEMKKTEAVKTHLDDIKTVREKLLK